MSDSSVPVRVQMPTAPAVRRHLEESERDAVVSYLAGGTCLVAAATLGPDQISGDDFRTPVGLATDGHHVWGLDAEYYVREYGIAPEPPEVVAVAVARSGVCPDVKPDRVAAVLDAIGITPPPASARPGDTNPFV